MPVASCLKHLFDVATKGDQYELAQDLGKLGILCSAFQMADFIHDATNGSKIRNLRLTLLLDAANSDALIKTFVKEELACSTWASFLLQITINDASLPLPYMKKNRKAPHGI